MTAEPQVHAEDLLPVRSRISWGAILGGAVLALSLYFLLTLLGAAMGLSISGSVNAQSMKVGAAIYAVIVTAICLYIGGCYASRLTVGENGIEGATYGVLVWAVVFGSLMFLMAVGVRSGFNAMVGIATAHQIVAVDPNAPTWEELARRAGVPPEQLADWKQKAQNAPATAKQAIEDPQNQQAAIEATTRVTWFTFIGAWLSMMTAAAGGYVGSGPTIRLVEMIRGRATVVRPPIVAARV
jgi:hypothetical protein